MEALMSPAEVGEYVNVPLNTVYAWNTRGGGPKYSRVGRHVRYRKSDVDAWLAENAVGGGRAA
ncbi:helix-turn-helix domain-containing protein [Lentzea nigeriaca]|uniref:helix-turn-helix domain-containing protein n=1 Tax=Lentzea nigeriaca TaxID=1128665 RepID=UPI0019570E37|nr:helix-turn-helix domain-containing protein [Lentzea nigeriaca]MBM7860425.1 excisionase family DNA binding protein [Lentzea nigeriaca]